jgi:hypothetical protein
MCRLLRSPTLFEGSRTGPLTQAANARLNFLISHGFLMKSLDASHNRDIQLADIASSGAATFDMYRTRGTVATFGKGRVKLMRRKAVLGALVGAVLVLVAGLGGTALGETGSATGTTQQTIQQSYAPQINPSDFTTKVDNKYFPLKPGTTFVYQGKSGGNTERDVMTVTHSTKQIMGVKCVVVDDRVFSHGKLAEKTFDWYAQDKKGNVWYFGENTKEYKNGKVSTEGSWEGGKDGAKPGIIMPAHPKVGQTYRQEYLKGVAEDMAKVLDLKGSVTVPYGSIKHALVTKEWSPLEPGVVAHKYYGAGVGDVKEVAVKGPHETLTLVSLKHTG